MIFNSISYERTRRRHDDVITARVDVSVEENDEPQNVMELAQAFIDSQLGVKADQAERDLEDLNRKCREQRVELKRLEASLTEARQRWEKAKEFLGKHNVSLTDDIPF